MNINLLLGIPDLHEDAFKPQGYGMKLFCGGGGYSPPPPPPAPTPTAPVQEAVAPADGSTQNADTATINANRVGKSKLRIDLDPLIASARGTAGGSGLGISG